MSERLVGKWLQQNEKKDRREDDKQENLDNNLI